MRAYTEFNYIFPPRPETKGPSSSLNSLEKQGYLAQPKLNGSCMVLFTDGETVETWDRHRSFIQTRVNNDELRSLTKNGWIVLVGEYLNKNQSDCSGNKFNHKFVIFDILVHENKYLVGTTFQERQDLLDQIYQTTSYNKFLDQISENVFRVKNFQTDLFSTWTELTTFQLYEGLVLKKSSSRLEAGFHPANNTKSQVKIRKEHKNYQH